MRSGSGGMRASLLWGIQAPSIAVPCVPYSARATQVNQRNQRRRSLLFLKGSSFLDEPRCSLDDALRGARHPADALAEGTCAARGGRFPDALWLSANRYSAPSWCVLSAPAGNPAPFIRFGSAAVCQANRTATGAGTASLDTTTRLAVDHGRRFDKLPVVAGDLEPVGRLPVARRQAVRMVETEHDGVVPLRHRPICGAGVHQIRLAIGLGQCPQRQPPADLLLVRRVDVADVAEVVGHGHAGIADRQGCRLSLPELRQPVRALHVQAEPARKRPPVVRAHVQAKPAHHSTPRVNRTGRAVRGRTESRPGPRPRASR